MASQLSSAKLLLFSLGLGAALSVPRSAEPAPGAFSLPVVNQEVHGTLDDLQARDNDYIAQKYGVELPQIVRRAGPGGSVTAAPIKDNAAYYVYFKIEGQTVQVLPDTGSAKFWVPTASVAGGRPAPYSWKPSNTSTGSCNYGSSSWNIRYADGNEFSGPVCMAQVCYPATDLSVASGNTPVFLATKAPNNNQERGILGLAHDPYAGATVNGQQTNYPTFFQSIIPNMPQPLFAMDLKLKKNGTIDFGYIDSSKYTGEITYSARTASTVNWGLAASGYGIGSKALTLRNLPFGIDSGAQRIYLPKDIVTQYHQQIPGATNATGGWDYPCSQAPPDFSFIIQGKKRTIPSKYILYGPRGDGYCTSNIQNSPFVNEGALFGMPFLRTQYVVFLNASSTYPYGAIGLADKNLE